MSDTFKNRTEAQSNASRANGAKSNGPVTPEGKARSSQNSTKHGLRTNRVVLVNESQQRFDALYALYYAEWRPVGQTELDLLNDMVVTRWRLNRIRAMETAAIDSEMFIQHKDYDGCFKPDEPAMRQSDGVMAIAYANPASLEYYARSEARLARLYTRARNDLWKLQTARLGHPPVLQTVTFPSDSENDTNEPGKSGYFPVPLTVNYEEPETFAWFSVVDDSKIPSRHVQNHSTPPPNPHIWQPAA